MPGHGLGQLLFDRVLDRRVDRQNDVFSRDGRLEDPGLIAAAAPDPVVDLLALLALENGVAAGFDAGQRFAGEVHPADDVGGQGPVGVMTAGPRFELDARKPQGHDPGRGLLGDLFFHVSVAGIVPQPAEHIGDLALREAELFLELEDLVALLGRRLFVDRADGDRRGGKAAGQDLAVAVEDVAAAGLDLDPAPGLVEHGRLGPGVAEDLDLDEPRGDDDPPAGQDERQDLDPPADVGFVERSHDRCLNAVRSISDRRYPHPRDRRVPAIPWRSSRPGPDRAGRPGGA